MSYQVLARKWRPKSFETLVGQEHVVRALAHALDHKRLHHAYLFTGTRGVGKTTLSRILAKSLNCVGPDGNGDITSQPCGVCRACTEIDAGRFVDYIEMDAASNRGVEEMAQLLEQAIYAPSNARFKVYMIDEVHMLTNHAFNAMLKTLEEPPEYVKFILATTDPQKIPATVLSRCLQFNLKQMPPAQIVGHLELILGHEGVNFEVAALRLLAHAAAGSMRDALSLTDQAIAYSAGAMTEAAVRTMLGALDQTYLIRILNCVADGDGAALLSIADEIAARSLSFGAALQDLAAILYRIAATQTVAGSLADDWPHRADIAALAERLSAEEVQLYYQIATHGRSELGLAPDEFSGFSMTLLRLLAFRPEVDAVNAPSAAPRASPAPLARTSASTAYASVVAPVTRPVEPVAPVEPIEKQQAHREIAALLTPDDPVVHSAAAPTASAAHGVEAVRQALAAVRRDVPGRPLRPAAAPSRGVSGSPQSATPPTRANERAPIAVAAAVTPLDGVEFDGDWLALVAQLKVTGLAAQLARNAELIRVAGSAFVLRVSGKGILDGGSQEKLEAALTRHFARPISITTEIGPLAGPTLAARDQQERDTRMSSAVAAIDGDPFVQALVREFGASVVPGSIRPLPSTTE